jgi:parvulin-like peptidyl-prolyl isomerase
MVEDLTKRLTLDSQQVAQLQQILDDSRKQFQDFRERHKDEMKSMHDRQHVRIMALLRPDQRVIYDKIEAERLARMERDEKK